MQLDKLVRRLESLRESDMKYVLEVLPLVVRAANDVPLASLERDEEQ